MISKNIALSENYIDMMNFISEKLVEPVIKQNVEAFPSNVTYWAAPRSTQPFILPRSTKWVPGISGNLVVKSKLPPRIGSNLEAAEPHP